MLSSSQKKKLISIVGKDNAFDQKEDLVSYSYDATAVVSKKNPRPGAPTCFHQTGGGNYEVCL